MPFLIFTVYALNIAKSTHSCVEIRKQVLNNIYNMRVGILSSILLYEGIKTYELPLENMSSKYPMMF